MVRQPRTKRAPPGSPGGRLEEDILELLAATPKPLGTYDILPLVMRLEGRRIYPSQIYNALDRLIGAGLVERVESLAAYALRHQEPALVLICTRCGAVLRTDGTALHRALRNVAERKGFAIDRTIVETLGHCAACVAGKVSRPRRW